MLPAVEIRSVNLHSTHGAIISGEFQIWDFDPDNPDQIRLSLAFDGRVIVETADDYFSALCSIRRVLELEQIFIDCYGSSLNVYPSPMSRDMGAGEQAYRLQIGEHARIASLVSIFDTGTDVIPSTVDEQESFFERWESSIS